MSNAERQRRWRSRQRELRQRYVTAASTASVTTFAADLLAELVRLKKEMRHTDRYILSWVQSELEAFHKGQSLAKPNGAAPQLLKDLNSWWKRSRTPRGKVRMDYINKLELIGLIDRAQAELTDLAGEIARRQQEIKDENAKSGWVPPGTAKMQLIDILLYVRTELAKQWGSVT